MTLGRSDKITETLSSLWMDTAHMSITMQSNYSVTKKVVVGLSAHSSHRTQVLDFAFFAPFKTFLRNGHNRRVYSEGAGIRNDIYTLCELIHEACNSSVSYSHIVNYFKAVGIWFPVRKGVVPEVIEVIYHKYWLPWVSRGCSPKLPRNGTRFFMKS